MKIKQIMPAPGWRILEAYWGNNDRDPEISEVSVIGWGVIDDDDLEDNLDLIIHDGDDLPNRYRTWQSQQQRETNTDDAWTHILIAPTERSGEVEICERLIGKFRRRQETLATRAK